MGTDRVYSDSLKGFSTEDKKTKPFTYWQAYSTMNQSGTLSSNSMQKYMQRVKRWKMYESKSQLVNFSFTGNS